MTITGWPLTLEQFLALPEAKPALEYGPGGEVTQKMSPTTDHSVLQGEFVTRINAHALPRRLGRAYPELRVNTGGFSRVPDVAFYRETRRPRTRYPTTAPDLAIEIASPEQSRDELADKCAWYVDQGATLALLVDPDDRTVRVFTAEQTRTLGAGDVLSLDAVVTGLGLNLHEVFAALD